METKTDFERERQRLTRWAWGVTGGYGVLLLVLSAFVVFGEEGVDAFRKMSPNEVGDLLAGVAGPVAFIWLVYGYFLQGIAIKQQAEELSQNTHALHLQEEALRAQVDELRNSVAHQHEIALAATAQTEAMRDTLKPVFSIRRIEWQERPPIFVAGIHNSGGTASNLTVTCKLAENKEIAKYCSFLQKEQYNEFYFENCLRPKSTTPSSPTDIQFQIDIYFEYGNGLHSTESFVFVDDGLTSSGKFVNRKSIAAP